MYIHIYTCTGRVLGVVTGHLFGANKAPTVNVWGVTSLHRFEELDSICPLVIFKRGLAIFVSDIAELEYCDFTRCLLIPDKFTEQIYCRNLVKILMRLMISARIVAY